MEGYSGGGCYEDRFFHVEERCKEGYISYTPAYYQEGPWQEAEIGASDFANTDVSPEIQKIFESLSTYLYERWITSVDDENVWLDLTPGAKRRLKCARRNVFYKTSRFNKDLLEFLSPVWPISLSFSKENEAFEQKLKARSRMHQQGLEEMLATYPEFAGSGLRFVGRQRVGRRSLLLFEAEAEAEPEGVVIVDAKWGNATATEIRNLAQFKSSASRDGAARVRAMLFRTRASDEQLTLLTQQQIEWRGLDMRDVRNFVLRQQDETLAEMFAW